MPYGSLLVVALTVTGGVMSSASNVPPGQGANKASSPLACELSIVKEKDGTGGRVAMRLKNTSSEPVAVRTNSLLDATLIVDIFDESGQLVSLPARRFTTADQQKFEEKTIPPGSGSEWSVWLAERVRQDSGAWGKTMSNVVVSLIYSIAAQGGTAHQPLVCTQTETGIRLPAKR